MGNQSFIKFLAIFVCLLLVFGGYQLLPDTRDLREAALERKMSDFLHQFHKTQKLKKETGLPKTTLVSSEGRQINLQEMVKGRITIVNFWASWCAPCLEELPSLAKFQEANPEILILPVSLDMQKTLPELAEIFKSKDLQNLRWFYDQSGDLRKSLTLSVYPTTMILDKNGHIIYILDGPANWASREGLEFGKALLNNF